MKIALMYKRVALNRNKIIHKYLGLRKKYGRYVLCKNETFLAIRSSSITERAVCISQTFKNMSGECVF